MVEYYSCEACKFTFTRTGAVETCPDCGSTHVRGATKEEKDAFKAVQKEFADKTECKS